jgi:phosphate transport system substrate-binding protein
MLVVLRAFIRGRSFTSRSSVGQGEDMGAAYGSRGRSGKAGKEGFGMGKRSRIAVVAGLTALALLGAACGDDDDNAGADGETMEELSGDIFVSGSSTVEPITALNAEKFAGENPGVNITVEGPGTGDGFELFCNGETDISDASRPIDEEEVAACEENGINYTELEVALDGITVMTSPENSAVECLTDGDLYALVGPESQGFENWSDADALAKEVGGTGNFPDAPLDITAPGEESGTYDAFIELAGFEDIGVEQGLSEDEAATTRPDYQSSPNDNVILQGIEGSSSSFGWVGFAYYENEADRIKAIAIDGGDGCVAPTRETIADGSYPLSRSLFIYVNNDKAAEKPAVQQFVDFYMSDEGLASVTEVGYVDLPADRIEAARSAWESA